jgi:hypothetical protein
MYRHKNPGRQASRAAGNHIDVSILVWWEDSLQMHPIEPLNILLPVRLHERV